MTLPLYRTLSEKPPTYDRGHADDQGHAGLWFDKFCNTWRQRNGLWSMSDGDPNPKLVWLKTLTGNPIGDHSQIREYSLRVVRLVENLGGIWHVFSNESRFVTGLGLSHPVENGFAWHPTLGIPYLPGSSLKGMVRAWARLDADPRPDDRALNRIFGEPDDAGGTIFFDAVPIRPVAVEADVMTPHYAAWDVDDPPGDWKSPIPIPFLVTEAHTPFLVGIAPSQNARETDLDRIMDWIREALEWSGAGAKTAVGYGRFCLSDKETYRFQVKLREERLMRDKERREKEELAALSPLMRQVRNVITVNPDMPPTTAVYNAIKGDTWTGDEKQSVAEWLRATLEDSGKWKPTTRAKKPQKDKDHQRTLQVQRWLDDSTDQGSQ